MKNRCPGPAGRPMRALCSAAAGGLRIVAFGVLVALLGCGGKQEEDRAPASKLTQAQRDSVLAESRLPGAGVVARALEAADSAEARADRLDEDTP